ncbi:Transposon Tf2-9 polyprotein [Linum perenne]
MGTKLSFSTVYRPQTDGHSERMVLTLEELLPYCVSEFEEIWLKLLSLVEFSYYISFHNSIRVAPFKGLYGRKCWMPIC